MPLCPRQAPFLLAALVYVPSLHCPVDPAGACASATFTASNPAATVNKRVHSFISSPLRSQYQQLHSLKYRLMLRQPRNPVITISIPASPKLCTPFPHFGDSSSPVT